MDTTTTFCTFLLGDLLYGIEVQHVQEVMRHRQTTRIPLAQHAVHGLMNLRGQIVTALDMRRWLGFPDRDAEQLPMNIVVRLADGPVSLLVDEIGDVIEADDNEFEATPNSLPEEIRRSIRGVYKLSDRLMHVLNTDSLEACNEPVLSAG